MRQEKGITTSSVIIYIIVILFVLATLTVISNYFFKVIKSNIITNEYSKTYSTFLSYFVQDIQEKGNQVLETSATEEVNYIKFSNGNTYKYDIKNKRLYKNNIKISDNIGYCKFDYEETVENKYKIVVDFVSGKFVKMGQNALTFYII